jgi:hypothetical protein
MIHKEGLGKSAVEHSYHGGNYSPAIPENCNDFVTIVAKKSQKENKENQRL